MQVEDLPIEEQQWYAKNGAFERILKSSDEVFFKSAVEMQKNICAMLKGRYIPPNVSLSLEEYKELYIKKFSGLNPKIKNLREQRNKIYAHNDKTLNFNSFEFTKKYPTNDEMIESLLEFALDLSGVCIALISGVSKDPNYINIKDWTTTLERVRDGKEYIRKQLI